GFRPRAGSSGTASTILAGPAGALGFAGELAADLFAPLNAYVQPRVAPTARTLLEASDTAGPEREPGFIGRLGRRCNQRVLPRRTVTPARSF
ncbi:MAG: hypothetical protein JXA30_18415, partial [Deltaproteobacteria bacterium]|nr:hypothetical protein [Deltaproteobacteria bacterium]